MKIKRATPTLPDPSSLKDIQWRDILPTFLFLAFSLITCSGILLFIHTKEATRYKVEMIMHEQQSHMEVAQTLLIQEMERAAIDLLAFANMPGIIHLFATPQDQIFRQRVNQGLSNFIQNKKYYEQIRVLTNNGRELARVEKKGQHAAIIPLHKLKDQSENLPFHKDSKLEIRGQILLSPMDLSRDEKGKITHPFHPIFHLGTPIFDQQNHKAGTLLFTYKGQAVIDLFLKTTNHHLGLEKNLSNNSQIVNDEGYWLLAPNKEDEWGSARDPQRRFDLRFPELWKVMLEQGQGQLMTKNGLFTFTTMPLSIDDSKDNDSALPTALSKKEKQKTTPSWLLITQISQEELEDLNAHTRRFHLFLFLVALVGSLPLLLWIAQLLNKAQQNKQQLQAQEQGFRLLFDKAPLPYQSMDQDGYILNINQAWLTATGYNRDEVLGRWFGDFVSPQSLSQFQESFHLIREKGDVDGCEVELAKKDGSTLLASFHAQGSPDDRENGLQIHCIFTDITELRAQKKRTIHLNILLQTIIKLHRLISQEKEEQRLVQACCEILVSSRGYNSAWIIILDAAAKIKNSAESGLFHNFELLKQQTNLGNPPPCTMKCNAHQGLVTIDDPSTFCKECLMESSYPRTGFMCAALEHNSNVYGYLNVSLPIEFIGVQEEKKSFMEIAKDIGYALFNLDQKEKQLRMERSLHQSEERLQAVFAAADNVGFIITDLTAAEPRIVEFSPGAEKIFGYQRQEIINQPLNRIRLPGDGFSLRQNIETPGQMQKWTEAESTLQRKSGAQFPALCTIHPLLDNDHKLLATLAVVIDISDRKMMEEQMLQSEKMTIIAGLAAGVAHEINTPLSAILQSIQVIRQSLSPDLARNKEIADGSGLDLAKVQDYFQKREIDFFMDGIRDSAIKSAKIISNLLQFSRPQKLEFVRTDLALLLDKSVELAKNDYDLRKKYDILNVEFIREYSPDLPQVSCAEIEIEQVFINLIKNAAQAMADRPEPKPKPRIILRTLQHKAMIRIEIEDNGPGMDKETRLHIFNPFFTTKDIGVGTGLGLSVSYTIIVTKHGGQLTVHSVPEQGTKMTIDLPINNQKVIIPSEPS